MSAAIPHENDHDTQHSWHRHVWEARDGTSSSALQGLWGEQTRPAGFPGTTSGPAKLKRNKNDKDRRAYARGQGLLDDDVGCQNGRRDGAQQSPRERERERCVGADAPTDGPIRTHSDPHHICSPWNHAYTASLHTAQHLSPHDSPAKRSNVDPGGQTQLNLSYSTRPRTPKRHVQNNIYPGSELSRGNRHSIEPVWRSRCRRRASGADRARSRRGRASTAIRQATLDSRLSHTPTSRTQEKEVR